MKGNLETEVKNPKGIIRCGKDCGIDDNYSSLPGDFSIKGVCDRGETPVKYGQPCIWYYTFKDLEENRKLKEKNKI